MLTGEIRFLYEYINNDINRTTNTNTNTNKSQYLIRKLLYRSEKKIV